MDDAARAVIVNAGYGPGYKYFTHRLGHGIGLDGHEHPYLVKGSKTNLEANMTFSNEPGIYVRGEFGMRCEDDMVIMPDGPAQLLTPAFRGFARKADGLNSARENRVAKFNDSLLRPAPLRAAAIRNEAAMPAVLRGYKSDRRILRRVCAEK